MNFYENLTLPNYFLRINLAVCDIFNLKKSPVSFNGHEAFH